MHRNVNLLKWFNFFTDFRLYAPLAIIYFEQVTGSFALGMSVFSVIMISSALLEIPTGIYSDRIGRKNTIVLGAAASVIAVSLYAVGGSFLILAIGAFFEGLSRSLYSGNNSALLYDSLKERGEEHKFADLLGKTGSMFQAALAISAVLGGFIATRSFAVVMWLSALSQLICFILSFFFVEPKTHSRKSGNVYLHLKEAFTGFVSNKKLRLLTLSNVIGYAFGESLHEFNSAFYKLLWPTWAIGLVQSFSHICATASFHQSGRFIKRFGAEKSLFISDIYMSASSLIGVLFPTGASPILMSSSSAFFGIATVASGELGNREFTDEQRATMGSLSSFAGSIAFGIVAYILGYVGDLLSPTKAILIFNILALPTLYLNWRLFPHSRSKS